MFIYGNSQQYNYYQTSEVMDKYFKSGSKSFTVHDKINYDKLTIFMDEFLNQRLN